MAPVATNTPARASQVLLATAVATNMDAVAVPWMTAPDARFHTLPRKSATRTRQFPLPRPPLGQYQPALWSRLQMDPAETSTLATDTPTHWDTAVATRTDVVEALSLIAPGASCLTPPQESAMPPSHPPLLQLQRQHPPSRPLPMDPAVTFTLAQASQTLSVTHAATSMDVVEALPPTVGLDLDARLATLQLESVTPVLRFQSQFMLLLQRLDL